MPGRRGLHGSRKDIRKHQGDADEAFAPKTSDRLNERKRRGRKHAPIPHQVSVAVDVESLVSLENRCCGCARGEKCCCSSYEVCITTGEMKRIIKYLPEAAKLCRHLVSCGGYDNVFEEEEPGLFSIDTDEEGLCLLAYWYDGRIRCSLHAVAVNLGIPLEQVKPKVCLLWPLHFSEGDEVLAVISDAFLFRCNSRKKPDSRTVSSGLLDTVERVYGEGCGNQVKEAAEKRERRTLLITRR